MECIFCDIAAHKVASKIVYEDNDVMAFLDINPVSAGHTLIIPKKHYENVFDVDEKTLEKIAVTAKRLSIVYKKALNINGVNLLNASGKEAQQDVFHFHLHLIPRRKDDGLNIRFHHESNAKSSLNDTLLLIKEEMDKR